jgi:DNA polymerase I
MIYLVTQAQRLFESPKYKCINIEDSINIINRMGNIRGLDTETTGLNPHTKELLTVQIGNKDNQIVIDCTTINIENYKSILEDSQVLYILANAKFDLQFFYKHNIILNKVYDVMLGEQILYLGYPKGSYHADLKTLEYKYLGKYMDKTVRGKITKVGLTEEVIVYAANDTVDLEDLMNAQIKALEKEELVKAVQLENRFVIPLAYMEWCGMKLDVTKWKNKMNKDKQRLDDAITKLNNYVTEHYAKDKRFVMIDLQGDLFNGFNTDPQCTINWNSAAQVIPLFLDIGINTKTMDKKTRKLKDSVDAKLLEPQKNYFPILPIYLDYKEAQKVCSTYGQNWIDQINPITGRVHTKFHQLGTNTARISSGGKDKNAGVEYVNFLNLPSDAETRGCFVAEKGNSWISIDYSGQESFLMASISNDKALIHELTEGSRDLHSLTAYMSYPDQIPRDTKITEIKGKYHHLRQEAKGIE